MPPKAPPKQEQPPKQPEIEIKPHELVGYNKFEYLSGVTYEGSWKIVEGKKYKDGWGRLIIPSHDDTQCQMYEGNWKMDIMQGFGTYSYPDGSYYSGQWKNNKHNGRGLFMFANGTSYEGQWSNHLMHGKGLFKDMLGRQWKGEFRQGVFQSRQQFQLIRELTQSNRIQQIKQEIKKYIEMLRQITKNSFQRLNVFFATDDNMQIFLRNFDKKYQQIQNNKWIQILQKISEGQIIVLREKGESQVMHPKNIKCGQMQGLGQIVEIHKQSTKVSLIRVSKNEWLIIGVSQ